MIIGIVINPETFGLVSFDNYNFAKYLGAVALSYILFSGGLETKWKNIKLVIKEGVALSTIGVMLTAGILGIFAIWILGFSLLEGLLLGAVVSSTDAAAVFSILRSKNINIKTNLKSTIELESGSNDPMAYFLTTGLLMRNSKLIRD